MAVASAEIAQRIATLRQTLPPDVRLIAVTKTFPPTVVRAAYAAGVRDFGENRVQEAIAKQADLADLPDITWHLIGHLQANKARKAVQHFQRIHTIDSLKLAQKLDQLAAEWLPGSCLRGCLQVKLRPDPAKYGLTPVEVQAILPELNRLRHLQIDGLMTIPPYGLPPTETQAVFQATKALADQINRLNFEHLKMTQLSMGMSADYLLAIAAGATMVRLGTGLFGDRT